MPHCHWLSPLPNLLCPSNVTLWILMSAGLKPDATTFLWVRNSKVRGRDCPDTCPQSVPKNPIKVDRERAVWEDVPAKPSQQEQLRALTLSTHVIQIWSEIRGKTRAHLYVASAYPKNQIYQGCCHFFSFLHFETFILWWKQCSHNIFKGILKQMLPAIVYARGMVVLYMVPILWMYLGPFHTLLLWTFSSTSL